MNSLEKWRRVCFSRNRNACFICCWGVREWMNLDFGKIAIMLDVRYLHFEYFVPQPPHPSVSLNLRVQWIVLPWEWDAARMMATITLHPNTYLVRHSSLWGFQFQNVIHACSKYGCNHSVQCTVHPNIYFIRRCNTAQSIRNKLLTLEEGAGSNKTDFWQVQQDQSMYFALLFICEVSFMWFDFLLSCYIITYKAICVKVITTTK